MNFDLPPDQFFFSQLGAYWQILAIKAACELGLPDYFNDGPKSASEAAAALGLNEAATFRLLRALTDCGVFKQTSPGTFEHTERSQLLRSDLQQTFKWMVLSEFGDERVPAWMNLPEAVRSGQIAWDHAYGGKDIWHYYNEHPGKGEYFSRWMTGASHAMTNAIHEAFDFSPYGTVVDVGGGQGAFLASIIERNPKCRGVLYDRAAVIETAPAHPSIDRVPGDFFEFVPEGADLYTLKWIIHDWEEGKAIQILRNVRAAMKPGASLLLVESVISEGDAQSGSDIAKWMDINMMVMTGGRERTQEEYKALLTVAGFRVERMIPTASLPHLFLAVSA
jgi:hypothetical protein